MASLLNSFVSFLRLPVLASSGVAAVLSGLLYFKQNELIYPRNVPLGARKEVLRPPQFGIVDFEELSIPTPDGEMLSAFLCRPSNKQFSKNITLLMFHGNAGNIGYRLPIAKILESEVGVNILMLQYRGYGLSTGSPNEKGLTIDAQTGLDFIKKRADLKDTKIVLYGQSLGGAVSVKLAVHNEETLSAIILENTFLSIRKLIPSTFPPAKYLTPLCHQIWPTEDLLPQIKNLPILFLSGLKDEIVPAWHMKKLFDLCKTDVRVWREFPNGTHNTTVTEDGYFQSIQSFIKHYVS